MRIVQKEKRGYERGGFQASWEEGPVLAVKVALSRGFFHPEIDFGFLSKKYPKAFLYYNH
jgi:hypothetical protein